MQLHIDRADLAGIILRRYGYGPDVRAGCEGSDTDDAHAPVQPGDVLWIGGHDTVAAAPRAKHAGRVHDVRCSRHAAELSGRTRSLVVERLDLHRVRGQ